MKNEDPFSVELSADLILRAYQAGIFPMAESADAPDLFWVAPDMRGIMPLDGFHISRSTRKTMRRCAFDIRVDTDFDGVISGCASFGTDRDSTWINPTIVRLYSELFEKGDCHTVEVWEDGALVGGLYGLSIGAAFFGESMFHRRTDASKIALAHLVERLNAGGYVLLDTQFITPHLESMGGIEIPREDYEAKLSAALALRADFNAFEGA